MAGDDWRLRIELDDDAAGWLLARLGGGEAKHLARELEAERLVVSHDDETVFVYAGSLAQLEQALPTIDA